MVVDYEVTLEGWGYSALLRVAFCLLSTPSGGVCPPSTGGGLKNMRADRTFRIFSTP